MDDRTNQLSVFTVDLSGVHREALDSELENNSNVVVEHHPGWVFAMSHADIVVVEADSGTGKEALEMLRMFQSDKSPCVVMYADDGQGGVSARGGADYRIPPALCRRIEQALGHARHRMLHNKAIPDALPDVLHG